MIVRACVPCTHSLDCTCVCAAPKPQSPGKPSSGPKQELQIPPPPLQPVHQSASAAELASQANQAESPASSEDEAEPLSSPFGQSQQPAATRQQEFSSSFATAPPTTGSKPQQASKPTMFQPSSSAAPPKQQQQQQQQQPQQQQQAPVKAEQSGKAAAANDSGRGQKDPKQEVRLHELRILICLQKSPPCPCPPS